MIPAPAITAWGGRKPWRDVAQVAQDLLLSALAIEIANHPVTRTALLWRGGTCLHQLHLPVPARYSEDLDYILLAGAATYRDLDEAMTVIASNADASVSDTVHEAARYKAFLTAEHPGGRVRVKVEVNTADAAPALETTALPLVVDVPVWYAGRANVPTFQPAELVGTKFRALAQRQKGRDLWDLDLARRTLAIADDPLATAAAHYLRHEGISPARFRQRLAVHVRTPSFLADLGPLVVSGTADYDPATTARRVIVWTDRHLDPLLPTHAQRRAREGSVSVGLRCPAYDEREGSLVRCEEQVPPGEPCPMHREDGPVADW